MHWSRHASFPFDRSRLSAAMLEKREGPGRGRADPVSWSSQRTGRRRRRRRSRAEALGCRRDVPTRHGCASTRRWKVEEESHDRDDDGGWACFSTSCCLRKRAVDRAEVSADRQINNRNKNKTDEMREGVRGGRLTQWASTLPAHSLMAAEPGNRQR